LTIEGHGFDNGTPKITVGNVECLPSWITNTRIYCTIQNGGSVEPDGPRPGHNGLTRKTIKGSNLDIYNLHKYDGTFSIAT
jgi:hypothetical protein